MKGMEMANALRREPLLKGVRVLDVTQYVSGPFCTRLLRDMGAEVIKIEAPPLGDGARYAPYVKNGYSGYFMQNNCGKKSVCLNLKDLRGRDIFKKLAAASDICVENFAPGVMKKLGLDHESLSIINPRLIMCSISGFGQYGPWANRPGYAATAHALSGLMWVAGKNRDPDAPPVPPGAAFGDTGAALHAFGAICAALYRREKDGSGEYIDIALLDSLFDQMDSAIEIFVMSNGSEKRAILSPVYKGRDGYATIALGVSDREFRNLAEVMNRPGLLEDDRFSSVQKRGENLDALHALIDEWLQMFEHIEDALSLLEKAGIANSKILSIREAIEHPQIKAREMMVEIDHPVLGKVPTVNSPFRLKHSWAGLEGLPPELGEHNEEVVVALAGYSPEEIRELEKEGVLFRKT